MGFISNIRGKFSKRVRKDAQEKHHSTRSEYLLHDDTPFDVTEAFRNLKAALSVSVPKKEGGLAIMMTSAYPEDGKTTVTVNLALMFALSDAKVILIDADIRKGRVAKYFKRKSTPGLSDYLSGQNTLDEVIHVSPVNENLSYITCGTHSPKPYELLESNEMKAHPDKCHRRDPFDICRRHPSFRLWLWPLGRIGQKADCQDPEEIRNQISTTLRYFTER